MIPYNIAFEPSYADASWIVAIDAVIDGFFFIDIAINFRTTIIDPESGDEIWDPRVIAKRYLLGGRFWIDLLSMFPIDHFGSG